MRLGGTGIETAIISWILLYTQLSSAHILMTITNATLDALPPGEDVEVVEPTLPHVGGFFWEQRWDGLGPNGNFMVIGAGLDPIEVTPLQLIFGSRTIQGWASGTPADSEDTLHFAELTGVRPMIETYPLEKAGEA